jgi:hypothetical protein
MGTPYPPGITEFDFSNDLKDKIPPLFLPPPKPVKLFSAFNSCLFLPKSLTIFQFLKILNSNQCSPPSTNASQLTGNFGFKSSTTALANS